MDDKKKEQLSDEKFQEILKRAKEDNKPSLIFPILIFSAAMIGVATKVNLVVPTLLILLVLYIIKRVIKK